MAIENITETHNSITEHLLNLTKVANENLQLLNTLNASLFTDATSLEVSYNDKTFYVPSFISVETRICELEENIKKITNVPKNGTTGIYYPSDGSMQRIVTMGFDDAPNRVNELLPPTTFNIENNYFFKDFITPNVYISFDLTNKVDNNIKQISVKKIILDESLFKNLYPLTEEEITLRNELLILKNKQTLTDKEQFQLNNLNIKLNSTTYGDIKSKLYLLTNGIDYKEFDKTYTLPYKNKNYYGKFNITNINVDLINVISSREITATVEINTLEYFADNGSISKKLSIGDYLITNDGDSIWEISAIDINLNKITINLKDGYTTLKQTIDYPDYYFKFYEYNNFRNILKISLEEDKYIITFISPINSELNVLAPWSNGIFINVDELNNGQIKFRDYYNNNIKNIGDILQGLIDEINPPMYIYSSDVIDKIKNIQPVINTNNLKVVAINEHLNDSKNISDLKRLHVQKNELKNQLSVIQNNLDDIQDILASTSFDNTTELNRQGYENKYSSLLSQKRLITQEMIKIINEISIKASENVIPLGQTKYRIRGFLSDNIIEKYKDSTSIDYDSNFKNIDIIKWYTEYRYKNSITDNSKAISIGDSNFLYTSWNILESPMRKKIGIWNNLTKQYDYKFEEIDIATDTPSYKQIDIPIQQGENVEIRTTAILNIGYPYTTLQTDFSEITTISFPENLLVNVDVIEIVEQNNEDAQNAQFTNVLINEGYQEHIDNKIIDQDKTYFHQSEYISSGFYTSERRIIPLKDKLTEIVNHVNTLEKTVINGQNNTLIISMSDGIVSQQILANTPSDFYVESYSKSINNYPNIEAPIVSQKLSFNITNPTDAAISIYSLLPGANNIPLGQLNESQSSYLLKNYKMFPMYVGTKWSTQSMGQFIYFRSINPFTSNSYFVSASMQDDLKTFVYDSSGLSGLTQPTDSNFKALEWLNKSTNTVEIRNLVSDKYTQLDYIFTNNHPLINKYAGSTSDIWTNEINIMYSQPKELSENNIQWINDVDYNSSTNEFINYKGSFTSGADIYTKGKFSLGAYIYPHIMDNSILSVGSGIENAARVIQPNETISIPIYFEYRLADGTLTDSKTIFKEKIEKTIAFDIRTSLFKEPEIYIAKVIATLNPITNEEQLRNLSTSPTIQKYITSTVI